MDLVAEVNVYIYNSLNDPHSDVDLLVFSSRHLVGRCKFNRH